jgi:VCBS repeat-containing protein
MDRLGHLHDMRWPALLTLCVLLSTVFGDQARGADPKLKLSRDVVKKDITAVIESQLAAFRANDFARAFTFAATSIKDHFSFEQFQDMVKRGYPSIAKSKSANFGVALDDGQQAVVDVSVKGDDDKAIRYEYMLVMEDGKWRITGVLQKASSGDEA